MFWNNFEALCAEKGVSYNAAAADVGVRSSGTVTGWKNGAKPRGPVLKRLADYFGVTVEELTGEAPEQKEKPNTLDGIELEKLSPARRALLEALDGMDDENIMKIVRIAQAVKKELPE
jgi:transcriptional regulator with XRE-family HTH domain